jgi:hypothetical protein
MKIRLDTENSEETVYEDEVEHDLETSLPGVIQFEDRYFVLYNYLATTEPHTYVYRETQLLTIDLV